MPCFFTDWLEPKFKIFVKTIAFIKESLYISFSYENISPFTHYGQLQTVRAAYRSKDCMGYF